MTDRDRLIELYNNFIYWRGSWDAEELADYLLSNGVIVPPCKVGDKVYWINYVTKAIETDIVFAIHQYENGLSITTDTIGRKTTCTYGLNRFLEIMYFTKKEAKKALKERER